MNFAVIDVEAANKNRRSICQIGIARFSDGDLVDEWETLINPNEEFGWKQKDLHKISEADVSEAPSLVDVADQLSRYLTSSVMLHHGPFDREAIVQAYEYNKIQLPEIKWLDTGRVVKRTWKDRSKKGWGLEDMAEFLGIEFKHHDALEDAKATAQIFFAAVEESGIPLEEWETKAYAPITPRKPRKGTSSKTKSLDGEPGGKYFGKTVVFTSGLVSMTRDVASEAAAEVGCDVRNSVTSKTNWVVIGDDGLSAAPEDRTKKHREALEKIEEGQDLQILCEAEFLVKIDEPEQNSGP